MDTHHKSVTFSKGPFYKTRFTNPENSSAFLYSEKLLNIFRALKSSSSHEREQMIYE